MQNRPQNTNVIRENISKLIKIQIKLNTQQRVHIIAPPSLEEYPERMHFYCFTQKRGQDVNKTSVNLLSCCISPMIYNITAQRLRPPTVIAIWRKMLFCFLNDSVKFLGRALLQHLGCEWCC